MIYNKHLVPTIGYVKISSNQTDFVLADYLESIGLTTPYGKLYVEIENGVYLYSSSVAIPSLDLDVGDVEVILLNKGSIIGKGGNGGNGVGQSPYTSSYWYATAGGIGGNAIDVSSRLFLVNQGVICGGGGGGGGGGGSFQKNGYIARPGCGGSGGGGGVSSGGSAGTYGGIMIYDDLWLASNGNPGGVFSGGAKKSIQNRQSGGAGGDVGRSGESGYLEYLDDYNYSPASGGLAGYYINGISNVIIANPDISKGNCTISNGTPGVVTLSSHGLITGAQVTFQTTDELPSPLVAGTIYYAIKNDDNTMWLATSLANAIAGTKIATTTDGSGTHSMYYHGTFLGRVV